MELQTSRLVLRSVSTPAAKALAAGRIPAGLGGAADYPVSRTPGAAERVGTFAEPDGIGMYLIIRRSDMTVIGDCSAERERETDRSTVWIYYEIARSAQRQGYAKEAIRQLVDWVLRQSGVDKVCAEILVGSKDSQHVAMAAGLVVTEERRYGQIWCRARQAPTC